MSIFNRSLQPLHLNYLVFYHPRFDMIKKICHQASSLMRVFQSTEPNEHVISAVRTIMASVFQEKKGCFGCS